MTPFDKAAFGITICLLSGEVITVENILMSFTVPKTPCASMKSPILNGLNKMIKIPPAKFESEPCNDKPIAKPAAPKIATNDEVSIPSFDITVTKRSILRVQKMRLPINVDNVTSTFRFIMIFLAVLVMKLVAHNPTNRITTATTNFGEYSKINFLMVSK